ncbi:MAG: DUF423 domain-containing protein [Pseudomonadota bacterium]
MPDAGATLRTPLVLAACFGLTGVILGAFGAHALADVIGTASLPTWKTAVQYQLFHACALFALAALPRERIDDRARARISALFGAGVVLFSGSLYLLTLDGPRWLGPITPVGGLLLISGWLLLLRESVR